MTERRVGRVYGFFSQARTKRTTQRRFAYMNREEKDALFMIPFWSVETEDVRRDIGTCSNSVS